MKRTTTDSAFLIHILTAYRKSIVVLSIGRSYHSLSSPRWMFFFRFYISEIRMHLRTVSQFNCQTFSLMLTHKIIVYLLIDTILDVMKFNMTTILHSTYAGRLVTVILSLFLSLSFPSLSPPPFFSFHHILSI